MFVDIFHSLQYPKRIRGYRNIPYSKKYYLRVQVRCSLRLRISEACEYGVEK